MNKPQSSEARLYTLQFGLLCLSAFLFFASFNMIIPELPDYLTKLGGEEYKGMIIGLFTITAGLSRPFSGKLADTIGRIPVMLFGAVVCFIIGFLYPLLTTVVGFLLLRFLHGFSTGFTPTGVSAYIADIIPPAKRGEAMGLLGLSNSIGMAAGPSLGGWLAQYYTIEMLFYTSSVVAFLAGVVLWGMKETLPNAVKFSPSLLKISWYEIFESKVIAPTLVLMLTAYSFGAILTIIPDFSKFLGIENKGLYFTIFTLSSLIIRFLAGKFSDKIGRVQLLRFSTLLTAVSLVFLSLSEDITFFVISAILFGVALGINSPVVFAWAIDLSDDKHRGRAMATLFIGLEIGITVGAFLSGYLYDNNAANFILVFGISAFIVLLAFFYLFTQKTTKL